MQEKKVEVATPAPLIHSSHLFQVFLGVAWCGYVSWVGNADLHLAALQLWCTMAAATRSSHGSTMIG